MRQAVPFEEEAIEGGAVRLERRSGAGGFPDRFGHLVAEIDEVEGFARETPPAHVAGTAEFPLGHRPAGVLIRREQVA